MSTDEATPRISVRDRIALYNSQSSGLQLEGLQSPLTSSGVRRWGGQSGGLLQAEDIGRPASLRMDTPQVTRTETEGAEHVVPEGNKTSSSAEGSCQAKDRPMSSPPTGEDGCKSGCGEKARSGPQHSLGKEEGDVASRKPVSSRIAQLQQNITVLNKPGSVRSPMGIALPIILPSPNQPHAGPPPPPSAGQTAEATHEHQGTTHKSRVADSDGVPGGIQSPVKARATALVEALGGQVPVGFKLLPPKARKLESHSETTEGPEEGKGSAPTADTSETRQLEHAALSRPTVARQRRPRNTSKVSETPTEGISEQVSVINDTSLPETTDIA